MLPLVRASRFIPAVSHIHPLKMFRMSRCASQSLETWLLPKTGSLVPCSARNSLDLADGMVTMGYLNEGRRGFMGGLSKLFGNADNADDNPGEAAGRAEVFICVNASTVELKDIERYAKEYAQGKTLVLWNMELDTLRADLGEQMCRPTPGTAGSCCN